MENKDNCRICRRAGEKLFLKGEKCNSPKCPFVKRSYAPGQSGAKRQQKRSDYAIQLNEKQKSRAIYGVSELQMRNYFAQARKDKSATGSTLIGLLEKRLDNMVYRSGFTESRDQARQLVTHRKILVNGKIIKSPGYQTKLGDSIKLNSQLIKDVKSSDLPNWLESVSSTEVKVKSEPKREDLTLPFNEQLIVEYYSR